MGYAAALAAVTLVSLFIGFVVGRINLANASMLYLFAVLATAVIFGRGPAVFAAIAAFLTFDWFFVQPLHQFTVSDPEEWISLLLFMLTGLVVAACLIMLDWPLQQNRAFARRPTGSGTWARAQRQSRFCATCWRLKARSPARRPRVCAGS